MVSQEHNEASLRPWRHLEYARYSSASCGGDGDPLRVVMLVDSLVASGGNHAVLQHAGFLARSGCDVVIAVSQSHETLNETVNGIPVRALRDVGSEYFDVVVPTWWTTVYELPRLNFGNVLYLVLSIESRFYEDKIDQHLAELAKATYEFGLPMAAVSTWIQAYLAFEHHAPSFLALNGIDKDRFSVEGEIECDSRSSGLRVMVEGPLNVPMKGVREALDACAAAGVGDVWLLSRDAGASVPGASRVYSNVAPDKVASLYRSCDVMLKLSRVEGMFSPPLEMMHCGGTIVTWATTGVEEYVEDGWNGLIVPIEDTEAAAQALTRLASDSELLRRLKSSALVTAAGWPSADEASRRFLGMVRVVSQQPLIDGSALAQVLSEARSRVLPEV